MTIEAGEEDVLTIDADNQGRITLGKRRANDRLRIKIIEIEEADRGREWLQRELDAFLSEFVDEEIGMTAASIADELDVDGRRIPGALRRLDGWSVEKAGTTAESGEPTVWRIEREESEVDG